MSGTPHDPPRVAVVVVTYNSADVLGGCLDSIPDGAAGVRLAAVVVADNASRDASVQIAEAAAGLPVRVVRMGRNAGYAAAVNAGVAALDLDELDAVFVTNPDCRLRPGALARLAAALRPPVGIAVPKLVNPDGSLQPSLRRMPTVGRAFAEAVIGGNLAGRIAGLGELVTDPREYERPGQAVWATGAALLVATTVIRDIGGWDESFLLYSEETEYALRAADHGWTLWYEPAAVVEHIGGSSSNLTPDLEGFKSYHFMRSTLYVMAKHGVKFNLRKKLYTSYLNWLIAACFNSTQGRAKYSGYIRAILEASSVAPVRGRIFSL